MGTIVVQLAANHKKPRTEVASDVGIDFGEEVGLLNQFAVQARGVAVAEKVAEHVEGIVGGIPAVASVPSHVDGIVGHVAQYFLASGSGLAGLGGIDTISHIRQWSGSGTVQEAENLVGLGKDGVRVHIAGNGKDGIVRAVETVVESAHVVQGGLLHMADVCTDGAPTVGMLGVAERPQVHPHVAVGLVDIALVVLLGHNPLLHVEYLPVVAVGVPVAFHPIGFEREGLAHMLGWQGEVIVGVVVIGESVGFATQGIDSCVEIGDLTGAPKHEVLKEMCKTCAVGLLVASPHTVKEVDRGQRS